MLQYPILGVGQIATSGLLQLRSIMPSGLLWIFFFFKILFIHEGEAGSLRGATCRIPGSHPQPKADAQPLSNPGPPWILKAIYSECVTL